MFFFMFWQLPSSPTLSQSAPLVHLVDCQRANDILVVVYGILLLRLHFSQPSPHFRVYVFVFLFFSFPTHVAF